MNSKVQSILGYLGLLLWAIAFFGGKEQRDDFSKFHLKQSLGLFLYTILGGIIIGIIISIVPKLAVIFGLFYLASFILTVIGIINAVNEVEKPLPVIGKMFEGKFAFIG